VSVVGLKPSLPLAGELGNRLGPAVGKLLPCELMETFEFGQRDGYGNDRVPISDEALLDIIISRWPSRKHLEVAA
jgi:hypothetical protein